MNAILLTLLLAADPTPEVVTLPRAVISGDETAVIGQIAELSAAESMNAKSYKWLLRPKPLSLKNSKPDGSAIFVSHDKPEIFEVELVAASADGQIDIALGELEIKATAGAGIAQADLALMQPPAELTGISATLAALRELHRFETELQPRQVQTVASFLPQNQPSMAMVNAAGFPAQHPQNAVGWPEGVKQMALRVNSPTRREEGVIVSGSFRAVANSIKTGTFSASDPWVAANLHAREALGSSYRLWQPFFGQLLQVATAAKQHGFFGNPEACVEYLESAAEVLGAL